jgi:ubiquinone/menaquinone biosynthesis C-methylase UbiE
MHHHDQQGERGGEAFDPAKWKKLESPERRQKLPPERLAEALQLSGSERIADIGCGTGFFADAIAPRCGQYIGIDHSPEMLEIFNGKGIAANAGNIELKEAKADALPLEDASVDIAFHVALMHEIPDIAAFHAELKRVVVPGGRVVVVDWEARQMEGGPPADHRLPRERVIELLQRDGLTVVDQPAIYDELYTIIARRAD